MFQFQDLFQWDRFITPTIIKAFYWLVIALIILFGINGVFSALTLVKFYELGANAFKIEDDGPAVSTSGTTLSALVLDESSTSAPADGVRTVSSASTGVLNLSTGGATALQTVNASGHVSVSLSAGDLTVGSITATNKAVSLSTTGAVLDGDTAVDITAQSLSITAASVGTASDALDTDVDSLNLTASVVFGDRPSCPGRGQR